MDIKTADINIKLRKNVDPRFISQYQLSQPYINSEETLGTGGFSKVKRATHIPTGQNASVKIISKNKFSSNGLKMIREEIKIQKQLIHQNICRLYEVQETNSKIYIFMEYCINGDLYQYVKSNGKMQQSNATKILKQIYCAIQYLHQLGFCHRDIKCENIVLDYKLTPKLIDFGMAAKIEKGQKLNTYCGSPSYYCPQLLLHKLYIPQKLDIWCLGVIFYALLTAQLPFSDSDTNNVNNKIITLDYKIKKHFSTSAIYFFENTFVFQKNRWGFNEIQKSALFQKYPSYTANYINLKRQKIKVDCEALKTIQLNHKLNVQSIQSSVQLNLCDSNCSIYYLTIVKMFYEGNMSKLDLNSSEFTKQQSINTKALVHKSYMHWRIKNKYHSHQQSNHLSLNQKKLSLVSTPQITQGKINSPIKFLTKKRPSMKFTLTSRIENSFEKYNVKVTLNNSEKIFLKKQNSKAIFS